MNVLEHYVTEIIGEPYYDDYGSGNYHGGKLISRIGLRWLRVHPAKILIFSEKL